MKISWQQLYRLPVRTESGQVLGSIEGVSLDTESQAVFQYHIKPSRAILGLFAKELLVSPAVVVSITAEAMVVKDNAAQVEAMSENKKTRLAFSAPKGVEMSETD